MKFGLPRRKKRETPEGLWVKCEGCGEIVFKKAFLENAGVCPKCDYHDTLPALERVRVTLDEGSFEEWFADLAPSDPLNFTVGKSYWEKIKEAQETTGLKDAIIVGRGAIEKIGIAFGCTDSRFFMGSMGSVVGEKLTRAIEEAGRLGLPFVMISGSGGGARMQEAAVSLMQMAKVSGALAAYREQRGFYISVLTNPTMGGVMASFASLGDLILAEPRALIGFTGPRVIQQTIRRELPEGFQTSEFMLEHGFVDKIVHRREMKAVLASILRYATHATA